MMRKYERLEKLSTDVKCGIPVNFSEALEVIEYQAILKSERTLCDDFLEWVKEYIL